MSDAARAAFEAHAEGYDAERRRLLPCFDAFYAAAIEAVGLSERLPERVLDLGAARVSLCAPAPTGGSRCWWRGALNSITEGGVSRLRSRRARTFPGWPRFPRLILDGSADRSRPRCR